jgi:hypothetical protein
MNNKLLEIKKLALAVFAISIEVNEKTEYNCWCDFSGHVSQLNIYCCLKGDETYNRIMKDFVYIKLDKYNEYEEIMNKLNGIKTSLLELLKPKIDSIIEDALSVISE